MCGGGTVFWRDCWEPEGSTQRGPGLRAGRLPHVPVQKGTEKQRNYCSVTMHVLHSRFEAALRRRLHRDGRTASVTLFLLLSQDWRLARIWLSITCTQASRSSYDVASKCHVWPVSDTMVNSKFSSCSVGERGDRDSKTGSQHPIACNQHVTSFQRHVQGHTAF